MSRRLPEVARGMGEAVKEFRKSIRDMKDNLEADPKRDEPAHESGPSL